MKSILRGIKYAHLTFDYDLAVEGSGQDELIETAKDILIQLGIYSSKVKVIDDRIKCVLDKMDDREYLQKTLDEIARDVSLSPSRLSHLFKQETNMRLKNLSADA